MPYPAQKTLFWYPEMRPKNNPHTSPNSKAFFVLLLIASLLLGGCGGSSNKGFADNEARLEEAAKALTIYDFDKAYKLLTPIQDELEVGTPLWEKATYTLALAAWHKSPPDSFNLGQATELLDSLIKHGSSEDLVATARIDLGRIYEVPSYPGDTTDVEKARALYREVIETHAGDDFGYQAIMRLAQTYVQQLDEAGLEEAFRLIQVAVDDYPENPWKAVAAQYLGDLYADDLGDYAKALEAYQIAQKIGFPVRSKADIYTWRMGIFAERAGQERLAMDYFHEVVTDFPRSVYGTYARDRIATYLEEHPDSSLTVPKIGQSKIGGNG